MFSFFRLCLFSILAVTLAGCQSSSNHSSDTFSSSTADQPDSWVAVWSTAPQLVEPHNNPPEPGLSNNTLRQVFRPTLSGDSIRMQFSNVFSEEPVTLKSVYLAKSVEMDKVDTDSQVALLFNGQPEITLEPGEAVYSDQVIFPVGALESLTVSIFFGETSPSVTGHPGSRTTSFIVPGNAVAEPALENAVTTDHWYVITGLEVVASEKAAAVAILGDSITDGRGSGTNKQNRWPDILAQRLQQNEATRHVAVLNQGIGGNCLTKPCLGPAGLDRLERDVLNQQGVRWLIVLEGVNDIGGKGTEEVADRLIASYREVIQKSHAHGIKVYGATILPFTESFYDSPGSRAAQQKVNEWIRTSGEFDAVIDFEKVMASPANPMLLNPEGDTGDHLHPNENGYVMMGGAVDLQLFQ